MKCNADYWAARDNLANWHECDLASDHGPLHQCACGFQWARGFDD